MQVVALITHDQSISLCVSCGPSSVLSSVFLGQVHGGSDTKCPLTVKILDAVKGTPAGPMALTVSQRTADGGWTQVASGYQRKSISRRCQRPCRNAAEVLLLFPTG